MSSLHPKNKIKIDAIINSINSITYIYGGQTENKISERLKQHQNQDPRFKNMKSKKILQTKSSKQINLAETELINQLNKKFQNKCINVINQGGGGQHPDKKDMYKLYVMYK